MRHSIRSDTPSDNRNVRRVQGLTREPLREGQTARRERAILVGILLPSTRSDPQDPLGELSALADSANVEVLDTLIQKRMKLSTGYALGKGKLEELKERVELQQADVVIFDNDLSPRQIRGVEETVGCKAIDRSELILDIFASRARSREAQLQVELAQLQYTAPRIRGMWTHLERVAGAGGGTAVGAVGGVGTRGPGERQIEIDRRIVKERINHLKHEIDEIDKRKQREAKSRVDQFTICLVGYTNSGKSTLMNKLTDAGRFAADMLFATLDTKTVRWDLGDGRSALLSDTVGFIRDLPHHLVASFRATLEEAIHADLLLHVVDSSSPLAWQQMESVEDVLESLGCSKSPQVVLLNKSDVALEGGIATMIEGTRRESLPISALTGTGLDRLRDLVLSKMQGDRLRVAVTIPHSEGKLLSQIDRLADVVSRRYESEGVELDLRITSEHLEQLRGRYPKLRIVENAIVTQSHAEQSES